MYVCACMRTREIGTSARGDVTVIIELSTIFQPFPLALTQIYCKGISLWAYFILNMCPRVCLP